MNLNTINETLIEYNFSNTISIKTSNTIIKIYHYLKSALDYQALGIVEITPCFTSIAISFRSHSPLFDQPDFLREAILQSIDLPDTKNFKTHTIEITYNGLDIDEVCQSLQLSKKAFIELHQKNTYMIAMLGFKGNFPYLLGLDKTLALPRRASPRNLVKKGSVAIAADQCGIYPEDSPGGWHVIANMQFDGFEDLNAGDRIIFKAKDVN